MKVLRLVLSQDSATYRVLYTRQNQLTYPLPPYSTIIGFLCNLLGIDDRSKSVEINGRVLNLYEALRQAMISIAGKHDGSWQEIVNLRNCNVVRRKKSKSSGKGKNKSQSDDTASESEYKSTLMLDEHGNWTATIVPVFVERLSNVELVIHIAHTDPDFLEYIRHSIFTECNLIEPLHLGKASDVVEFCDIFHDVSEVFDLDRLVVQEIDGYYDHYFYVPQNMFLVDGASDFGAFSGIYERIPAFSNIEDYEKHGNRDARRIFDYVKVKICTGKFVRARALYDNEVGLPVFLAKL
jgi:CRISPR-associated protein Cas5t